MRPTLKDIAQQAGVSFQTVSLVVNHPEKVAPATRARVQSIIDSLGFVPDMAARALRKIPSKTIACVTTGNINSYDVFSRSSQETYLGMLVQTLVRASDTRGFALIQRAMNDQSDETVARLCGLLAEGRVDGMIVFPTSHDDKLIAELRRRSYNYIAFGLSDPSWNYVDTGNSISEIVEHLIATGRRRIGFMRAQRGDVIRPAVARQLLDYKAALKRHKIPFRDNLVVACDWSSAGGYRAARELLGQAPDVDAIFAANDRSAFGVLKALYDEGVPVPEQIAVVGFDNFTYCEYTIPSLTSVDVPTLDMAEFAIGVLVERIGQDIAALAPAQKTFPTRLVVRDSTGRPRPARRRAAAR